MRILGSACVLLVALSAMGDTRFVVDAKKPSRSTGVPPRRGASRGGSSRRKEAPVSRRRAYEDEDDEDIGFPEDDVDDEYDEEDEEVLRPVPSKSRRGPRPGGARKSSRSSSPPPRKKQSRGRDRYAEDDYDFDEEDYEQAPPSRRGRPSSSRRGPPPRYSDGGHPGGSRRSGGRVVPYSREPAPGSFATGFLAGLRDSIPDPSTVREAAAKSLSAARETSSKLSTQLYREVKGLTSSELEQVMLKATRPDDTPVKGKHVERLVGVTYQISGRYDIYDAVLRKLWKKMAEKDWRTTIKSLYVLHRFSADGAPEHAAALKARLRELRRTRDPKRKDKYFNSKQLLAGDSTPENVKYRAFMARYAHYVLLRAQCFGGIFDEISQPPPSGKSKKPQKPITSGALRPEHLEAAIMVLKAGLACALKDGEECENTAIAAERVASDLIGLTSSVAIALNRALKGDSLNGADPALIKRWCEFYSEQLLPETRAMVKKTSSKLDAYGLFLPSRMGTSVSQEIIQKGLNAEAEKTEKEEPESADEDEGGEEGAVQEKKVADEPSSENTQEAEDDKKEKDEVDAVEEADEYDEYDYEEEEYYDDEES